MAEYMLTHTGDEMDNAIENWNLAQSKADATPETIVSGFKAVNATGLIIGTFEPVSTAAELPIADEGNYYDSTDVEGALQEIGENKVDKMTGKQLSTEDYTSEEKLKLAGLTQYTDEDALAVANALISAHNTSGTAHEDMRITLSGKVDKSNLVETDLRIAKINKDLSDYKATLSQLNPNQEPTQTSTDYGRVSLPVNAANGQVDVVVGGMTAAQLEPDGRALCNDVAKFNHHYYDPVIVQNIDNIEVAISEGRTDTYFGWDTDTYLKPNSCYFIKIDLEWVSGTNLYFRPCNGAGGSYIWGAQNGRHTLFGKFKALIDLGGNNDWHVFELFGAAGDSFKIYKISQYEISADEYNSLSNDELSKRYDFLPYGTYSTVSAMRIVSESEDKSQRTELYIPDVGGMRSTDTVRDEISCNQQTGQWVHIMRVGDDGVALSNPITAPVNVSGTLLSYPKGTVYAEPVLPVAGIYTADGISVTNTDFPISRIDKISVIDFYTGIEHPVDVSEAVIAGDGLSFTHPDLSEGIVIFFTYFHSVVGTSPKISATYYDSRYVIKDTATGKFYKKMETVTNGELITTLVEVS